MNEKDCFDDFIVGFGFGVGRVPLASPRPSLWLPSPLRFKMRGLLNSELSFSNFYNIKRSLNYFLSYMASEKDKGGNKMKKLLFGTMLLALVIVVPIPTMAQVDIRVSIPLPPPIVFAAPPEVIVIPETYVYVVPEVQEDIFFHNGWWWRPWGGRWYRSRHYSSGWVYYQSVPSFYVGIPSGWRNDYRDHRWGGHQWNYQRISHQQLQQNWSSWEKSRHWEKQQTWGVQGLKPRAQSQKPSRAVKPQSQVKPQSREVQPQHSQPEVKPQSQPRQGKPERGEVEKQDRK